MVDCKPIDQKVVRERIDVLKAEAKEEDIVRGNHIEMANRIQLSIAGKQGAVRELMALIQDVRD